MKIACSVNLRSVRTRDAKRRDAVYASRKYRCAKQIGLFIKLSLNKSFVLLAVIFAPQESHMLSRNKIISFDIKVIIVINRDMLSEVKSTFLFASRAFNIFIYERRPQCCYCV